MIEHPPTPTQPGTPDSWHSYPKVHAIGHMAIKEILLDEVLIEEKVDGSQFSFGRFGDVLKCRSKGQELDCEAPEKMFTPGVQLAKELFPVLRDGWTYRGEFLGKPKHNTLGYSRIPKNCVILFDINDGHESYLDRARKEIEAVRLGLEVVPLLGISRIDSAEHLKSFLGRESILGGANIEGVVIKNYSRFGKDGKALMGKFVSEEFKEIHGADWKERNPGGPDIVGQLILKYKSQARYAKAVQHLQESDQLENAPRDIGKLIPEFSRDLLEECEDEIKAELFKWAWPQIQQAAVSGLPTWYKDRLLQSQFENEVPHVG